jgi:hypothetical protein
MTMPNSIPNSIEERLDRQAHQAIERDCRPWPCSTAGRTRRRLLCADAVPDPLWRTLRADAIADGVAGNADSGSLDAAYPVSPRIDLDSRSATVEFMLEPATAASGRCYWIAKPCRRSDHRGRRVAVYPVGTEPSDSHYRRLAREAGRACPREIQKPEPPKPERASP